MYKFTSFALFCELWVEYGISIVCILLRFGVRARIFGFRHLDIGDAFAGLALLFYTFALSSVHFAVVHGHNVGLNLDISSQIPDSMVSTMERGSKHVFMFWIWYINLLWSLKGILLVVYFKMGIGVYHQEILVRSACAFTILCWMASILCHMCKCTPISRNWQVKPYPGDDCTLRPTNYLTISTLNALSDLFIILVPMPLLLRVKVPLPRKMTIISLFAMGFFCITATILRAYYSLLSLETLSVALGWTSRELFVGTIVACAPGLKPLISTSKWFRNTTHSSRDKLSQGARLSGFMPSNAKPAVKIDGTITVSRSVDVYHTQRDNADDLEAYELEMTKWRIRETRSAKTAKSDEMVIIEEGSGEMGKKRGGGGRGGAGGGDRGGDRGGTGGEEENSCAAYSPGQIVRMKDQV